MGSYHSRTELVKFKVEIEKRADPAFKGEDLHTSWHRALVALQSLQTPLGVMASGQDDHFHAIFGRDSLWTVLFALEAGHLLRTSKRQEENIYSPSLVSFSDQLGLEPAASLAS